MATSPDNEVIVEVNAAGEMIGPVDRKLAHENEIAHAVVMIVLYVLNEVSEKTGEVWLSVRSLLKAQYPGYASVTVAGHIEYEPDTLLEELAFKNAHKELGEETDFIIDELSLVAISFLAVPGQEQQLMYIFTGETTQTPVTFQEEEVAGMKKLNVGEVLAFVEAGKISPFTLATLKLIGFLPADTQPA